jgi:hypothetical protein
MVIALPVNDIVTAFSADVMVMIGAAIGPLLDVFDVLNHWRP